MSLLPPSPMTIALMRAMSTTVAAIAAETT
jgi:hypothetical protein